MKNRFFAFLLLIIGHAKSQSFQSEHVSNITFPAGYAVGSYFEVAQATTITASASGYFEVSITYTRGNLAAASTFIVAMSHANPDMWREAGAVNTNDYTILNQKNFTVDVNGNSNKFRVRAINTYGDTSSPLTVYVKIRSINFTTSFTSLNNPGTEPNPGNIKLQPMTNDWNLYVGNPASTDGAKVGIKVNGDGNVGIGVNPQNNYRLGVNGTIHAKEVNIDLQGWADHVFKRDYRLPTLEEVERHIQEKGHLPSIPSEEEVMAKGVDMGDNQRLLLQKIEELTLYSIQQNKQIKQLEQKNQILEDKIKENEELSLQVQDLKKLFDKVDEKNKSTKK